MIKRHLVRGYNEKVYYAESTGSCSRIQQLSFHKSNPGEIANKEIISIAGSRLAAFEADGESTQNDIEEGVP